MPEFEDRRSDVQLKREALAAIRKTLYTKKQQLRLQENKIKQRLESERLAFLPDSDSDQRLLLDLQEEVYESKLAFDEKSAEVEAVEKALAELDTHVNLVNNLDDSFPILLMPLRLQTRFVTVKHLTSNFTKEMILDVSPYTELAPLDKIQYQTDTFTQSVFSIPTYFSLREGKGGDGHQSWAENCSDFVDRRVPYRDRSWLKLVPDTRELWVRVYPDEIFVHSHETHLTLDERDAGLQFWETWWDIHFENKDALKEEHRDDNTDNKPLTIAWSKLQKKYRHTRAAWIFKETMPANYLGKDTRYKDESGNKIAPDFSTKPASLKSEFWTEPILSFVLPDKFVFTLFQNGNTKTFEGKRIPFPLQLSPNPNDQATLDEILWTKDFEEAERMGMAIKIPLESGGYSIYPVIDKLVVVGIKTSVDEAKGKEMLESLFENHRFRGSGMAILPQGTATNNFENFRSGYSEDGLNPEEVFKLETGKPLFDNEAQWKTIKDGAYLVEALGINPAVFQYIQKSDSKDIAHTKAMNRLLWSATMGYHLSQFFQPAISPEAIQKTRDFLWDYVGGNGLLPVFRVGKQPYGILPTTNFANWKLQSGDDPFFHNLFTRVLQPLSHYWDTLIQKVLQVSDPNEAFHKFSGEFVKILGLSPSSQMYFERPSVGNYLLENAKIAGFEHEPFNVDSGERGKEYTRKSALQFVRSFYRRGLYQDLKTMNLPLTPYDDEYFVKERIARQHLSQLFRVSPLNLVDQLQPSEKRGLSKFKIGEEEMNYLEWLKKSTFEQLREEHFPIVNPVDERPRNLLYFLARQAIARSYIEVAASLIPNLDKTISTIDFEMEHLANASIFEWYEYPSYSSGEVFAAEVNQYLKRMGNLDENNIYKYLYFNNKWAYLHRSTADTEGMTIGAFLDMKVEKDSLAKDYLPVTEAKRALDCLEEISTAALQRTFSEHLDLCSYRLDSWLLGLVNRRLVQLRDQRDGKPHGIYLGAYGYLEKLDPQSGKGRFVYRDVDIPEIEEAPRIKDRNVFSIKNYGPQFVLPVLHFDSFQKSGIDIDDFLAESMLYLGNSALGKMEYAYENPEKLVQKAQVEQYNQGFIHTTSQAHAVTAAILRSGYMANNAGKATDEFAINLSSARVRKALFYLEGLQNGQELPAMLGYQFERNLHDSEVPYLDAYLQQFRNAFPLQKELEKEEQTTSETVEVRNVVHGLDLINFYREKNEYMPGLLAEKGINLQLPGLDHSYAQNAEHAIKSALDALNNHLDAISDLLMAESVYHVAKGDLDHAGAILKMLSNDKDIEIPEIVKTPRTGKPLSHIIGVQFNLKNTDKIWAGVDSPRSLLNPGLNHWLGDQLPNSRKMCFNVEVNGVLKKLSIRNLLLQPIDLLALFQEKNPLSETSALTYLIREVAIKFYNPPLNAPIKVLYYDKRDMGSTQKTLGELKPLFDTLVKIVHNSRPIFPTDLQLSSQTRPLEKEFYDNLDNSAFIEVFETIVNGQYKHSLHRAFSSIRSYTQYYKDSKEANFPEENQQTTYTRLLRLLHDTLYYNQLKEDFNLSADYTEKNAEAIIEKGERTYQHFEALSIRAKAFFSNVKEIRDKKKQWEGLVELAKMIFGNTLMLTPNFLLNNPDEYKAAKNFPDLMADAVEEAQMEWLQGVSLVREKTREYKKLEIFRNLFEVKAKNEELEILQLPYQTNAENYRWLGTTFSPQLAIKGEQLSIALEYPSGYKSINLQSGIIIDSWTERIQTENRETAFALHYNQPNSEPPQSLLLCITPEITGNWQWEDIIGSVVETMDLAKKRAVEPALFEDKDQYIREDDHYMKGHPMKFILPALTIPVTNSPGTPGLRFDEDANHS